jgi:hypothetical protein
MTKPDRSETAVLAVGTPLDCGVGRLVPERDQDGEPYWDDRDEDFDDWVCDRCHGDGADPWTDYLLPCPACQGEQR